MHFFTGSRSFTSSLFPLTSSLPSPSPRATKIQQPKIFPHSNKTSPNTFPAQKSLPTLPRANHEPTPGFFGPNQGQFGSDSGYFGSEPGYFGSIPGFPGPKSRRFGPRFLLPGAPSAPGDVQKLRLSSSAHNRAPSTLISRSRTNYRVFITFTSKNTPLSL